MHSFLGCWQVAALRCPAINTGQPRQGQVKVARQVLPGKNTRTTESRQGRLKCEPTAVPAGTVFHLFCLTRQFLPGYSQPRLPALSPGPVKILRRLNVSGNVFCISERLALGSWL